MFHHDFTASFLIFTALVNIHHFILDGAIWKLREGRVASVLLASRETISHATGAAGDQVAAGWKWMSRNSAAARTVRIGCALALLTLGTVDQIRYYYALHRDNLTDLQRAVDAQSGATPEQEEEWRTYLFFLREHASVDGSLPPSFTSLVDSVFGDILISRS